MKYRFLGALLLGITGAAIMPSPASAQNDTTLDGVTYGNVFVPSSSIEHPVDIGVRAHTNYYIGMRTATSPDVTDPEDPSTLRSVYDIPSTGGSDAIAIVDAYNDSSAVADFNKFSNKYGLPTETGDGAVLQVVYATTKPSGNPGWNVEEALDIEYAHAMSPGAKIYLVEAKGASFSQLFAAVKTAANLPSVKEVSMSWSGSEFSGERSHDSVFKHTNVVYFAATGDYGAPAGYPATSVNVVACGGTTINRDSHGNFVSETGWSGSGGGPSALEPRPSFQNGIALVGSSRGTPDVSFDADPNSGVTIYCKQAGGWVSYIGGTSVATPSLAGITNLSGHFFTSTNAELTNAYANMSDSADFYDVITGNNGYPAGPGYDFVTGIGAPRGTSAL